MLPVELYQYRYIWKKQVCHHHWLYLNQVRRNEPFQCSISSNDNKVLNFYKVAWLRTDCANSFAVDLPVIGL